MHLMLGSELSRGLCDRLDEPGVPSWSLRLGVGTHTWAIHITSCSVEFPRGGIEEKGWQPQYYYIEGL